MKLFDNAIPWKDRIFNSWMFYMYGLATMGLVILITIPTYGCCTPTSPELPNWMRYALSVIEQKLMNLQTWRM